MSVAKSGTAGTGAPGERPPGTEVLGTLRPDAEVSGTLRPNGATNTRAPGADQAKARRLGELREFLTIRRARVSPADAGLPAGGGRRRTPGLRREEVAVLAGVGASWYQWLEQGRDISVSPQVLDSVARVLRLSSVERRHLYVLAGLNPPAPQADQVDRAVCGGLERLIDTWMPYPAHIMDAYWNCVRYNAAAAAVLGMRPEAADNCLIAFFTDPLYRSRSASWERNAAQVVAEYRAACSDHPDDDGFLDIVHRAKEASPEFAALWERQDVAPGGLMRKELQHPRLGALFFESAQMRVPARPDLVIVLHTPQENTETARKLQSLASPAPAPVPLHPLAS